MKISKASVVIGAIITIAVVAVIIVVSHTAMTGEKETSLGSAFTYDLKGLYKIDPTLIKYKEANRIKTGFQNVSAIATDSKDHIYVAGDRSIRIFGDNGNILSEIKLADSPRCLTVSGNETIYVGMKDHIEVYDLRGIRKARWESPGQKAVLTSVAVSGDNVFVADAGDRIVLRYDISGRLVNRIGKKDKARDIPGFVIPSPYFDIAVAPDGLLRVANPGLHRIEAYTFNGDLEFSWGEASAGIKGFSGCCNPVNFAILPNGKFVTCEKGIPRIKIYGENGILESVVAGAELFVRNVEICVPDEHSDCQSGGIDVAVDSKGRILVLDPLGKSVRVFIRKFA